jgi:parallel beta-helix repeat protein
LFTNKLLRPSLFVVLVLAACFAGQTAQASTVIVGTCKAGIHFATIQLAVNASPVGGTVDVCPGTYQEQVSITKNLTLIGIASGTSDAAVVAVPGGGLAQTGNDIYGSPVAAQILVVGANVTVSHLTVDGSNNGVNSCGAPDPIGIYYQNASGTITDNAVRNVLMAPAYQGCQLGLAINVEAASGTPAVTISKNSVRNYDKNGITASGNSPSPGGPAVTVTGNTVIGLGATDVTAQNGIQIGFGATGTVTTNYVVDNIYINPPACSPCYGSSGILVYASSGVTASNNTVESAQLGIVPATDPSYGNANGTIIKSNHIGGTQNYDAIDLCSDGNTAQSNTIFGSAQSGVHVDDSCSPSTGSNNTVISNTINEACAGVLLGTGTGNTTSPNTYLNVTNTTLAGDVCTPLAGPQSKHQALRPSPYKSGK